MHIYVILIYTREGLCMYKMHRDSLVRLDFQLKSGFLCIHILRSGYTGALLSKIFFVSLNFFCLFDTNSEYVENK